MTVTVSYSVTLASPPPTPAPSTPGVADPPERRLYAADILRVVPPWLRRRVGGAVMMAFGGALDAMADRLVASAALSFPRAAQPDALALVGRDRGIQRGPTEADATYAARLRPWWSAHRGRGGAHALLRQLRAFWPASTHPTIDVVAASGLRYSIDAAGTITRSTITWTSGDGGWCRLAVVFYATSQPTMTPELEASYRLVPREWSAAHVSGTTVTVVSPGYELWDYPAPMGPWDEPGGVWNDGPVFLEV